MQITNGLSSGSWHVWPTAAAILAIISCISGSQALARNGSLPRLASADWSVAGPTSVGARPLSLAEVQAFMNYLRQVGYPVGGFRFASLRNIGTLSLVTCADRAPVLKITSTLLI